MYIYKAYIYIYMYTYIYGYVYKALPAKSPCDSAVCASMDTGWRRLIGSPKLQIIFHKRATKYRSLLRKMIYEDKGSYESSPPCMKDIKGCREWIHDETCVLSNLLTDIHICIYVCIANL